MFNFKSTQMPNLVKSRASYSDPTLSSQMRGENGSPNRNNGNGRSQQNVNLEDDNEKEQNGKVRAQSQKHSPIRLPPLVNKSMSFTSTSSSSISGFSSSTQSKYVQRQQKLLQEPKKKLPSYREMLFLTLKHVPTPRGLTFDQLYQFITGAFELPKTYTLESNLRKTLSNMTSKGVVVENPGVEPQYSTYQVAKSDETAPDLSISGHSVPQVPTWPNGYNLPAGGSVLCRRPSSASRKALPPPPGQRHNFFLPNPMSTKLDPMPYMPIADPMICQSFGMRAGLKSRADEARPNSPTVSDVNPHQYFYPTGTEGVWTTDHMANDDSQDVQQGNDDDNNHQDPGPMLFNGMQLEGMQGQQFLQGTNICSNFPPKPMTSAPRFLDTVPQNWSLAPEIEDEMPEDQGYARRMEECEDEDVEEVFINDDDGFEEAPGGIQPLIGSLGASTQTVFDLGESPGECERRNRSCRIMNDLRGRGGGGIPGRNAPMMANVQKHRMNYLLGIADIIDSYESQPPPAKMGGGGQGRSLHSRSKLKSGDVPYPPT